MKMFIYIPKPLQRLGNLKENDMKKTTATITAMSVMALAMGIGGMAAHADVKAPTYAMDGLTATTPASVVFTVPTENDTKPGIPGTDPENPEYPADNEGTQSRALLKIGYMSNLDFDTHEVSSKTKEYNANLIDTTGKKKIAPFILISDNRGTAAGWHLNVKQDQEFKNKDGKILRGAYVEFKAPELLAFDASKIKEGVTSSAAKLTTDGTTMPIMQAEKEFGNGSTYGQFGEPVSEAPKTKDAATPTPEVTNGISMHIIGGTALATQYETSLTWTLSATPV